MIKHLTMIANELDSKGEFYLSDRLDALIKAASKDDEYLDAMENDPRPNWNYEEPVENDLSIEINVSEDDRGIKTIDKNSGSNLGDMISKAQQDIALAVESVSSIKRAFEENGLNSGSVAPPVASMYSELTKVLEALPSNEEDIEDLFNQLVMNAGHIADNSYA